MQVSFEQLYTSLNSAQKKAVDTIEGPVMVIAGPGTGKTTILTLRIANILKLTDTPANGILAITYTDAGVKAMRTKLQGIIGDRAHDVRIHTFHSFASSIISEYQDHFLHLNEVKQMTDIEQESLIRKIIEDQKFVDLRPAGKPDVYVSGIIRGIDEAKREAMTPEMVRAFARSEIERIQTDEESISTRGATKGQLKADAKEQIEKLERTLLFADIYDAYESGKREAKRMDFNDLIIELLLALREDELLLRLIQERYLYIHVDEHQDTNDAQNFILSIIAEFFDTPNVFIVGDEKQAIYRFQGASVENFLKLQKKWPNMEVIKLDQNYRSHQSILDGSFSMIEKNYEEDEHRDLRVRLRSGSKERAEPIEIITGENTTAIEFQLIERLRRLMATGDESDDVLGSDTMHLNGERPIGSHANPSTANNRPTVAIIVRRNRDLDRIIRLCEFHGIKISSERSIDIFNHPVGKIFFDLLQYIVDPTRVDLVANTIIVGMWGLDFATGTEIVKKLRSGTFDEFDTKIPGLSSIRAALLSHGPIAFIVHAGERSGYTKVIDRDPIYINVWRGIVSLAESLARDGGISDPAELITRLLAYRTSAETRTVKVSVGAPDLPIQAMTAHGSKGLEFDYVFIPYATEEAWIGRPKGASFVLPKKRTTESEVKDVRRLFYVALTRARKHAVVMTSLEESDGKTLTPLRFIDELDEKHIKKVTLDRLGAEKLYEKETSTIEGVEGGQMTISVGENKSFRRDSKSDGAESIVDERVKQRKIVDEKILDIAKNSLTKKGLSVTSLNHFLKCPNQFIYQSILKMPQAPSVAAEKGTAMHEALSRVWTAVASSSKVVEDISEIQKIMDDSVSAYFSKSLLSAREKVLAKSELAEDMPAVARALSTHFSLKDEKSTVLTESWVESIQRFKIYDLGFMKWAIGDTESSEKIISIPIHGKLDAILDNGHEVTVFDYKTKLAMSENAIKGETKNSDGNYFRQLVFYKILVGDDKRWKGRRIHPALVFVSPDAKGRCPTVSLPITEQDEKSVIDNIRSLVDAVWSGEIVKSFCDDPKCEWCGLRRV